MTQNGSTPPRSGVAVAVAAAALTLATGLTVGALTGYIAPPRSQATAPTVDPPVVFVPVRPTADPGVAPAAPTADPTPPPAAEPDVVYANQETRRHHDDDDDDDHEGREHEGREHEGDDD